MFALLIICFVMLTLYSTLNPYQIRKPISYFIRFILNQGLLVFFIDIVVLVLAHFVQLCMKYYATANRQHMCKILYIYQIVLSLF